jgi:hypothetical protein
MKPAKRRTRLREPRRAMKRVKSGDRTPFDKLVDEEMARDTDTRVPQTRKN